MSVTMTKLGELDGFPLSKTGIYLLGLATAAAGVLDLIWGEFEPAHQPIGGLGDHIPGQTLLAYMVALCMIAAGLAALWRPTARTAALAMSFIYSLFSFFWLPRFYTAPHALGFSFPLLFGLLAGIFTQLVVVAGCLVLYWSLAPPSEQVPRRFFTTASWVVGLGSLFFGLTHLTSVQMVAGMVPNWMPVSGSLCVIISGIGFVAAALAILTGIMSGFATRLLSVMLMVFEVILLPTAFSHPHQHVPWGSNAYNLAAAAAVWIVADSLQRYARRSQAMQTVEVPAA